jgi:hypothetical protein
MFENAVQSTVEWAESNFAVDYSKVSVQTSPGNYKEAQLCALLDDNQKKVRWCYMVEKVLDHYHFESDKIKFIEQYFFKQKGAVITCLEVGICRATLFNWENEIIETAYKWAKELKLIKE